MRTCTTPPTRVTTKQNDYLLQLATGPKTTHDLMHSITATAESAGRMMRYLRNKGLIKSAPQAGSKVYTHKLTRPYPKLNIAIYEYARAIGAPIREEDILYAAILRNGGMTGQRLKAQYIKVFTDRTPNAIDNIVTIARKRKLCR